MTLIRATLTEGNRTWIAHGETRTEAIHRLRIVVNREVRSGQVHFEDVSEEHDQLVRDYIAAAYPNKP